jgi:hypothetical protein
LSLFNMIVWGPNEYACLRTPVRVDWLILCASCKNMGVDSKPPATIAATEYWLSKSQPNVFLTRWFKVSSLFLNSNQRHLPSTMRHFLLTSMSSLNVMTNSSSAFLFAAYWAVPIFVFLGTRWRRSCRVKQWSWWTDLAHPPRSWSTTWGVDCFESFFVVAQSARFIRCLNQDDGREEGKFYMMLVSVFCIIVLKDSPDW